MSQNKGDGKRRKAHADYNGIESLYAMKSRTDNAKCAVGPTAHRAKRQKEDGEKDVDEFSVPHCRTVARRCAQRVHEVCAHDARVTQVAHRRNCRIVKTRNGGKRATGLL